jgi:signal-transduction protein with cAMP-binding, CBS, and nucleotidyltransferase domain
MPEPQGAVTEYHDEYSETLGAEVRKLEDALLSDTVSGLISVEPLRLQDTTSVEEAVQVLLARDQSAVVVVDQDGHLNGIATDRDLLRRACEPGRNTDRTRLADVMTHDPETLRPDDRICFAVNRMMALGCRTMPLVDEERRPIGLVTVDDVAKWLAALFPEAILNLRPGDRLKRPAQPDGG